MEGGQGPAAQPQTQVVVPGSSSQANPIPVNPPITPAQGQVLVQDASKAVLALKHHWMSPAFWSHAVIQVLAWVSYFQTASTPIQVGSLSVSVLSFIAYLVHLAKVM